jgi:GntR family transcriptional regulator
MIPSEVELAARFKVSQGTMRKAIDELAPRTCWCAGRARAPSWPRTPRSSTQYRFLRLMPDDGVDGRLQRRLLECRRMRAPAEVARALELQGRGVRRADPPPAAVAQQPVQPVVLDDIWLPGPLFKGLTAERLGAWRGPMYGLFEAEFGVRMVRAEERSAPWPPTAEEAALLAVSAQSRCCSSSACRTPTATAPSNCVAACTAPTASTTATS